MFCQQHGGEQRRQLLFALEAQLYSYRAGKGAGHGKRNVHERCLLRYVKVYLMVSFNGIYYLNIYSFEKRPIKTLKTVNLCDRPITMAYSFPSPSTLINFVPNAFEHARVCMGTCSCNESKMDLQSRLLKLRKSRKKSKSESRYRRWGHGIGPAGPRSIGGRWPAQRRGPFIPEDFTFDLLDVPQRPRPRPVDHENDDVVNDFSADLLDVPQRPGPVDHENDDVVNDFSADLVDVPQRPGPVIQENDHVVNYLFPSTERHGNEPIRITYPSDAESINDRDDFDIEMDEILSEELTSNVEENDINEPELEHTYLESETLNEHEESANNSCSSSDDERPEYEGMGPLDYNPSILMLAREWILTHLGRNCSNSVADDFFQFALDHAQLFLRFKEELNGKRNVMTDLRRKVMQENLPPIKMDYIFKDKSLETVNEDDDLVHAYDCDAFPKKKYPADKFELVSQVTRVKVSVIIMLFCKSYYTSY